MTLPPSALAPTLRALLRVQRGQTGARGPALERVARLAPGSCAEVQAERAIHDLRAALATSPDTLEVEDWGAGTRDGLLAAETRPVHRRVAEVYARAAATPAWGRFLFRLVRELRPTCVLELGTSLGVSAGHLALALQLNDAEATREAGAEPGRLVTLEGDAGLAARARSGLASLGVGDRVEVVVGPFARTLPGVLAARGPFDLVFVDGHHEEAATLRHFEFVRPHLAPGACVAFDDVEPLRPVRRAWRRIVRAHPGAPAADLLGLGLLFLDAPAPPPASAPAPARGERARRAARTAPFVWTISPPDLR